MTTAVIPQPPITGEENLGDVSQPEQALAQFYRAFNYRDLAMMEQNWDNSDEAVITSPLGGIMRGWREIHTAYEHMFASRGRLQVEFYDYSLHVFSNVFYAVGRERGQFSVGDVNLNLAVRTTNIFRRNSGGRWQQIHHHASFEDAQLLADYQAAI